MLAVENNQIASSELALQTSNNSKQDLLITTVDGCKEAISPVEAASSIIQAEVSPLPENLQVEAQATQKAVQQIFDKEYFEKEYGIATIREHIQETIHFHHANFGKSSSSLARAMYSWVMVEQQDDADVQLQLLLDQQVQKNGDYSNKIRDLENELTNLQNFEKLIPQEEGSALERLLDEHYDVDLVDNATKIHQKHLSLMESLFVLHYEFFNDQEIFLNQTIAIFEGYSQSLYEKNEKNPTDSQVDQFLKMPDFIDNAKIALEKVKTQKDHIVDAYQKFEAEHKQQNSNWKRTYWDIFVICRKYIKNRQAVFNLAIEALDDVREYILKHPSKQARKIMNNLFLVHKLLIGDDPNVELLARHTEKTLLIDSLLRGYSLADQELPDDPDLPENIQRFAAILEILPRAISLFEGMKSGSFLPLISITLFAEAAKIPGAWIFPLANVALGAFENLLHVTYIQQVNEILTEEQRTKMVSFFKFLDKKFSDMEELHEQRLLMASFREAIDIEKGAPPTHIFQRMRHNFTNFTLKMQHANKVERTVRLIGQIAIPLVIFTAAVIAVIAAAIGIAPIGIVVVSYMIAAIATTAVGAYTAYQVGHTLSRWIDEWYSSTVKLVNAICQTEESRQKLNEFLKENESSLKDLCDQAYHHLEGQVKKGNYDPFLASKEFENEFKELLENTAEEQKNDAEWRKQQFLEFEKEKIKTRLSCAAYIKHHHLTKEEVDILKERVVNLKEGFDVINTLLNPEESLLSDAKIMQMATNHEIDLSPAGIDAYKEMRQREI